MFCLHLSMETFSSLKNYPTMGRMSPVLLSSQSEEMKDGVTRLKQFTYHTLLSYSSTTVVDHMPVFSTTVTFDSRSQYHLLHAVTPKNVFLLPCSQKVSSCPCACVANVIYSSNFPPLSQQNKLYHAHVPACELSICCSECRRDYLRSLELWMNC